MRLQRSEVRVRWRKQVWQEHASTPRHDVNRQALWQLKILIYWWNTFLFKSKQGQCASSPGPESPERAQARELTAPGPLVTDGRLGLNTRELHNRVALQIAGSSVGDDAVRSYVDTEAALETIHILPEDSVIRVSHGAAWSVLECLKTSDRSLRKSAKWLPCHHCSVPKPGDIKKATNSTSNPLVGDIFKKIPDISALLGNPAVYTLRKN
ncbi:hypothetical protein EGW08_002946 [Elysia chlorotica]|uniref:Uncharacterized protein n=1 Tax=Elysia chlorotica TaxID=188477 RepID=A0A3S0ZXQ4_ELYCH|nr:hypothetical protein EGW08_002946 [Elysia chlorotica]